MARPTTKQDLLLAAKEQYEKMWKLIDGMTEEEQQSVFNFEDRDKNLRDILIHLYEWHQLLLNWVKANQNGELTSFLPKPYNWRTYPQMNIVFWENHQNTPYIKAVEMVKESHANVIQLIEAFTNDELFTKKHFSWTGTTSLGSYGVSATSSHYVWAMKKMKMHLKTYKKPSN